MRQIKVYTLKLHAEPQGLRMPRRARVLHVNHIPRLEIELYAEVDEDHVTKAFDTNQHERMFLVLSANLSVPEGAGLVGADRGKLVYETGRS